MRIAPLFLVFPLIAAACKGQDRDSRAAEALADTVGTARRLTVVPREVPAYRVQTVDHPGRISGSVVYAGTPRGDTLVVVPADENGCGRPLAVQTLHRRGDRLAGAVVWITDVRAGRALPFERRYELENDNCAWTPMLQLAAAGGTLNVSNYDPLVDRVVVTDVATRDTVATVPFTDNGQVIPYDGLLRKPGVYELSVESRPMSRAWIAVLDTPYSGITDENGSFSFDGVPPGTHTIRAWHPVLGVTDGTATVAPDGTATITLQFHP